MAPKAPAAKGDAQPQGGREDALPPKDSLGFTLSKDKEVDLIQVKTVATAQWEKFPKKCSVFDGFCEYILCKDVLSSIPHFFSSCQHPHLQLLHAGKDSSVIAAAGALENLAFGEEQRVLLAEAGAIPPLCQLLQEGSRPVKDAVTKTLAALANSETCRLKIEAAGAVPQLVRWMVDSDSHISKCLCAIALRNLAVSPSLTEAAAKEGAVVPLVSLLSSHDLDTKVASAGAIMNLAASDSVRASIIQAGAINPLVDLVQSDDVPQEGKLDAEQALCNLVLDANANKDMTKDDTIVRVLINLVRSGSPNGRELAALALEDLGLYQDGNRRVIAALEGIPPLVALVSQSKAPLSARRAGARAIASVAITPENRALVAECQGVEALAGLLADGSEMSNRVAAAQALSVVCTQTKPNQDVAMAQKPLVESVLAMLVPYEEMMESKESQGDKGKAADPKAKGGKGKDAKGKDSKEAMMPSQVESRRDVLVSPEEIEAYEEARRAGSTLVISLGEANPVAQEAFAKAGAVPRLVDALMTGSEKSKSAAAMAVRVLASLPANQQAIPGEGAVAPLVELLGSQSPVAMEAAAGALGMLASRQVQANQTAIAEAGGVPALARVLAAGDVSARIEAADAIRHLVAGHRANQDLVAHEEHALHGVVKLLTLGHETPLSMRLHAQEVAAATVRDLVAGNQENMTAMARADGIEPLVDILILGSESGKEIAANALVNLAGVTENVRRIINAGAIEPMVTMLQSPFTNDEGRRAAAGALGYLATNSKATQILIAVIGAIGPLVALVKTGNDDSRTAAALALANLAKGHWPIQRDIAEAGGVESIVLLLGGEIVDPNAPADPEQDAAAAAKGKGGAPAPPDYSKIPWRGREAAARALESLADLNIDVQAYAARAGCVAPLMDLLRHEEFSAKEWAARAIAVLAQLSRNIAGIAESPGGMQPLVDVLKAQHAGCQEAGCIALHNLAVGNDDVRQRLVEMGALEQLAAVLKGDNLVCRMQAARAVTVMAQADAAKQQLVAAGVIQGLIQQLSDPSHPTEVLESAARCVTQLSAGQAPIQAEMAKGGVVPLLVTLLESKTEEIRDSAAIALWSLASHPAVKQSLAEAGAMDKLVRVVGQGAAKLLKQPVPRSHDLEEGSDDVEREVLEAVRGLVDLLCSGTDGGKKDAAWGLVNISKTGPNRKAVAKAGAVPLLVNLLVYGSKRAQAAAAWSLWRLTCSEHTRSLVADKRYVSIVNNVLGAGNASARIAACGCLADIAEGSPERLSLVVDAGSVSSMTRLLSPDGLDETPPQNRIPRLSALQLPGVWAKVAEGMREAKAMDRVASAAMVGRRRESLVETAERVQSELEKDSGRPLGEDPVKDSVMWSLWRLHDMEKQAGSGTAVLDVILDGDTVPAAVQMLNSGSYHGRHGAAGLLGSIAERGPTVQATAEQAGALEGLLDILGDENAPQTAVQEVARSLGSICWRQTEFFIKIFRLGVIQKVFEVLSRAEQPTKEPLMWLLWQTAAADKKHREAILAQPNAIAKVIDVLKEEPEPGNDKVLWKAKRCACGLLGLLAYQNKQAQEVLAAKDSLVPLMEIVNYRFGNPRPIRKEAPPKPPPEPTPPPEAAPANAGKGGKGKDKKGKAVEEPPKEEEEEVKEEVEEVMVTDDEAARCDWVRCVEESCGALKNLLYENRALQEEMLGRDGLDVLMRAMRMEDEGVAASACNLMRIMCRSPTLQRQFLSDPNILQTMILLEDFRFALEVELEPNPAHPDNMTREAAEVAEAPGPAPRAAPGGGQEREFVSQKSAKKRGGHRLAAAVRNEDLRISTPEEDAARGGPAVVPKELARVKLRAVPNGARVMQAVASVFAEISKGVEQVQNFMAARHVVRVLVDVLRSADVAEGVKMACLGALVNVGHKNFKVQQAIHDSSAIAALVELLGESTAPFEQLQARSSRLEDGFVKRSSAGSLKAPLSRTASSWEPLSASDVAKSAAWCLMNLADYHIHLDVVAKELINSGHIKTPGVMFKFLKSVTLMNQALSDSEDEEEEA